MARSDSRIREESQRIQAKCLMETHVKGVFGFVLFMDVSGLDIPDLRFCKCCWSCTLDVSRRC